MIKPWFLRLHRWAALVFALPLAAVLVTGLILAFEPMIVTGSIKPGSVDAAKITRLLAKYDPEHKARGVSLRSYADTLTIIVGRRDSTTIDLASEDIVHTPDTLATWFRTSRRLHETLLLDARWLVTTSTIVMLVLIGLGLFMGLPRLRNTVSGWHKGMAWVLLPLVILSPLTGLAMVYRITFTPPIQRSGGEPALALADAVRVVGGERDLSHLIWLRQARGRMLARVVEDGEYRVYTVSRSGMSPMPRNWPRLLHEGNWGGFLSASLNVLTSIALIGLLGTGLYIWGHRQLVRRRNRAARASVNRTA